MTHKQTKFLTKTFAVIAIGSMLVASVIQAVYMLGMF